MKAGDLVKIGPIAIGNVYNGHPDDGKFGIVLEIYAGYQQLVNRYLPAAEDSGGLNPTALNYMCSVIDPDELEINIDESDLPIARVWIENQAKWYWCDQLACL